MEESVFKAKLNIILDKSHVSYDLRREHFVKNSWNYYSSKSHDRVLLNNILGKE